MPGPVKHLKGSAVSSFEYENTTFEVGDSILFNADTNVLPYIGKFISGVYLSNSKDDIELTVAWYYRPEEAVGGRKVFHGEREIFSSDHTDQVHRNTVVAKCYCHTLPEYEALKTITDVDYFVRFHYCPVKQEFEPDQVPVYCTCCLPYNPDNPMIMCEGCEDWFHFSCVKEAQTLSASETPYYCKACTSSQQSHRSVETPYMH
mmetsp:Transcript_19233/g.33173  ORF Transcript_19233/g.33173 Transcript_19233/m.33173 type:complete len:204 (-) Transcript_19233:872-1483(-)|eukprot:CAMPEP_0119104178 /NCGR_PEP_ID=MMETSP1180-20130426/2458_1 /TAXON_ID=3052 ORGANISM="Chlamydomonas cf sp, Strain CCMP681" /NCGR_SAMPLE_ID=MMETSP1180 /ASSEMBLY_ACC=CAM_ASM_000741 /LENGTH=203 /DNA_ID=CAMNT_0007088863 /DNA_START=140 /DNA_END=751 /DNA_ORIENTATION=-